VNLSIASENGLFEMYSVSVVFTQTLPNSYEPF
jgi:hypothetical protein